jgi:hypothetical protein
VLTCFQTSDCAGTSVDASLTYGDACSAVPNATSELACLVSAPPAISDEPSCGEAEATMDPVEPFAARIEACPPAGAGGCDGELTCKSPTACLAIEAGVECPGDLPERLVTFAGGDDGRSCAACGCAPESSCEGGGYLFHDRDDCSDKDPPIAIGSSCTDVTVLLDTNQAAGSFDPPTLAAVCVATGAQTGSGYVTPSAPRTYCCPEGGGP